MASRFVSGGAIDAASGEAVAAESLPVPAPADAQSSARNEEWEAARRELDEERRRREEQRAKMAAGEEKSLFDILQANKAAKQDAFEEQAKLKNQFRALDDDEIDFLSEVRDSTRAEEARVRRETADGLRHFREAQLEREKEERQREAQEKGDDRAVPGEAEDWSVGRKRKREVKGFVKGVRRRVSEADEPPGPGLKAAGKAEDAILKGEGKEAQKPVTAAVNKPKASLVDYGSDSDSDGDD